MALEKKKKKVQHIASNFLFDLITHIQDIHFGVTVFSVLINATQIYDAGHR